MKPTIVDTKTARLAAALGAREMTRADLAHLLGCSVTAIARWADRPAVTRGGPPAVVTAERIAAALAIPAAALEPGGPWGPLVGVDPHRELARQFAAETPEQADERVAAGLAWLETLRPTDEGRAAAEHLVDEVLALPPP